VSDPTENVRRVMVNSINSNPETPEGISTEELTRDYDVEGFMAPFVVVIRKSDGKKGTFIFKHAPRVYFNFQEN